MKLFISHRIVLLAVRINPVVFRSAGRVNLLGLSDECQRWLFHQLINPYQFCQDLAHIILRHLKVKPLDNEVYLLEDVFEPFTIKQVDILRKETQAINQEVNQQQSYGQNSGPPFQQGCSNIGHPRSASPEVSEDDETVPTWD